MAESGDQSHDLMRLCQSLNGSVSEQDLMPPVTLFAHFDESGKAHDKEEISFSGWLSREDSWAGLIPKWESLLKDSFADYFHATSLKSRGVQLETFAHLLAAEYGGHAIFTALDAKFFRGLPDQFKNRVGNNPHHMLFRMAVNLLLDAADEEEKACGNRGLVVSLICDQDEETSTMCLKWINKLKKSDPRARRRIASICFADSRPYRPAGVAA